MTLGGGNYLCQCFHEETVTTAQKDRNSCTALTACGLGGEEQGRAPPLKMKKVSLVGGRGTIQNNQENFQGKNKTSKNKKMYKLK